jgi:hypothetical protein
MRILEEELFEIIANYDTGFNNDLDVLQGKIAKLRQKMELECNLERK